MPTNRVKIIGVSVKGSEAIVRLEIPVINKERELKTLLDGGGKALGKYFMKPMTLRPNETFRISAELIYRKFDTGWKLESY